MIIIAAVAVLLAGLFAPGAGAEPEGGSSTTSTVPGDRTTTTTTMPPVATSPPATSQPAPGGSTPAPPAPAAPPGDVPPEEPPYVPPVPAGLEGDPRLPYLVDPGDGGIDVPLAQSSFDPRSVNVLPELVEAATLALFTAQATLTELQLDVAAQASVVAELEARVGELDAAVQQAVERVEEARRALGEHAVSAYIVGDVDERLALVQAETVVDMGVARAYVHTLSSGQYRLLGEYERAKSALDGDVAELAIDLGRERVRLNELAVAVPEAFAEVLERSRELQAYEAGAQAYIDGFVFPVAGDVEFIDSWGYPRMMGTPSAHWHQGTDIFAIHGTPLIAAENGELARVGTASLGGNKLWVRGDSGNEYYYAHLSAFAPGIEDGRRVRAGEVIGYVGDTGNARGTSPHLHFEIHPDGRGPVNPYPLLKAAYGNRPVLPATVPVATDPADVGGRGTSSVPAGD